MNKIFSFSIAAYNLGSMIEDNLKSFVKLKNIDDVEVLVIDDGSKDNTVELAEKYHIMYPNSIKIIKQKNAGPGSTVNTGIKNATGLYFKMVDGDDWINTEAMDELIEQLKNFEKVDAIITNDLVYSEKEKKIVKKIDFNYYRKNEIFNNISIKEPIIGMHSMAFRTEILKNNKIELDKGFYTDVEYLLYPLPYVKKIIYFDLDIYVYRVGRIGQSVSYKSLRKNINMHNEVLKNITEFYNNNKNIMSKENAMFVLKRISDMNLTKITLLLGFEKFGKVRSEVKKYIEGLKSDNVDIYNMCLQSKKIKLLTLSNYFISYPYSFVIKQKISREK